MGWWSRLGHTLRPGRMDDEIGEELRHYLDMRAREGVPARQARLRFGAPERIRAETHDHDVLAWLESGLQDLRYAGRMLRRSPAFTAVIVASLAIGLGANAAIFSLVNAVLIQTLPVPEPQQIALLGQTDGHMAIQTISYPLLQEFANLGRGVGVQLVSSGYFSSLGVHPQLGRFIAAGDNRALGASAVAVLSYGLWQSEYGGATGVIGQTVRLGTHPLTIIGVAPRGFTGMDPASPADLWTPVIMQSELGVHGNRINISGDDAQPWPPQEQIFWLKGFARFPARPPRHRWNRSGTGCCNRVGSVFRQVMRGAGI